MSKKILMAALVLSFWLGALKGQQATLQIIHNILPAGEEENGLIDIYVNGTLLTQTTALSFRSATAFLDAFPIGSVTLDVAKSPSANASEAFYNLTLDELMQGETYILMLYGQQGNMDFAPSFSLKAMARNNAIHPDSMDIQVFNGSPDLPSLDAIELALGDIGLDLDYGNFSDYLTISTGFYGFEITPEGIDDLVGTFFLGFEDLKGEAVSIFTSGYADGTYPFINVFAALADGTVLESIPASLAQFIHNIPASEAEIVDLYSGNFLLQDDFHFLSATQFVYFPSRFPIQFGMTPSNSMDGGAVFTNFSSITLEDGKKYVLMAHGDGSDNFPYDIAVNEEALRFSSSISKVFVSLFNGAIDAPGLDFFEPGIGEIVENLEYGAFSNQYLEIDPGSYAIQFRDENDNLIGNYEANIDSYFPFALTLFTSGYLDGSPNIHPCIALPDSRVLCDLFVSNEEEYNLMEDQMMVAPNPTDSWLEVQYTSSRVEATNLSITNAQGKLVFQDKFPGTYQGPINWRINVAQWAEGMYYCRLFNEKGQATKKVVINRAKD